MCVVRFGTHRCLNSAYRIRFGKPFLQILIPSRTPLHLSWWRTRKGSITPGNHIETLKTSGSGIQLTVLIFLHSTFILGYLCYRHVVTKCWCFIDSTWILGLVGDDAADKVRLSCAEVSHQLIKILLHATTQKQTELKTFSMLRSDNISVSYVSTYHSQMRWLLLPGSTSALPGSNGLRFFDHWVFLLYSVSTVSICAFWSDGCLIHIRLHKLSFTGNHR